MWYSFRHLHFDQLQPGFSDHPGPGEVGHKLTFSGLGGDAVRLEHWAQDVEFITAYTPDSFDASKYGAKF